jgi:hypothetical protein
LRFGLISSFPGALVTEIGVDRNLLERNPLHVVAQKNTKYHEPFGAAFVSRVFEVFGSAFLNICPNYESAGITFVWQMR